jgi:tetrahydromethanopterin S-methyltransferase subunit B
MAKDLDESVDKLEAAVDPNTVISVGGYNFTPAKLMVAGAIVSSTLGFLYGAFEVYKDYMSMKEAIANYVTPDLSEINKKLAVVTENSDKAVQYTQDIKNDLKSDIRRLENIVDTVERSTKQSQRELDGDMKVLRKETEVAIKETNANMDRKIQRALDNPLANK